MPLRSRELAAEGRPATQAWTHCPCGGVCGDWVPSVGMADDGGSARAGGSGEGPAGGGRPGLVSSRAPQAAVGSSLVATVTGEGGASVNGGTVSFTNNGAPIGSAAVRDGRAEATWRPAPHEVGQGYELAAHYSADRGYIASQSEPQNGEVAATPDNMSQTALTVEPAPQAKQASTLTATVTGGARRRHRHLHQRRRAGRIRAARRRQGAGAVDARRA